MYKLCKTEQSAQRQRELERGLLNAMSTHQYEEISVSDLCDQMEIPRKSFYRYFSSKDGALHALIDHTLLEFESFPSNVTALESYKTIKLLSSKLPAIEAASFVIPSIKSPSPHNTYTR